MREIKEDRLLRLFEESKKEVEALGIKLKSNITIYINHQAKSRLGQCISKKFINISDYLFNFDDPTIKNTIIHEILHTLDDTHGHDVKWKWYANKVNKAYSQYNITRTANVNAICNSHGLAREEVISYKYRIQCPECNNKFYRHKLSSWQKRYINSSDFKCPKCNSTSIKLETLR